MIESEIYQFLCFHERGVTKKMLNLIRALKANSLKVYIHVGHKLESMRLSHNEMLSKTIVEVDYTCYTVSVYINLTDLYI